MLKMKSIYIKYLLSHVYFQKENFSQTYLIWAPNLDVLKIGIPLSKWTQYNPWFGNFCK